MQIINPTYTAPLGVHSTYESKRKKVSHYIQRSVILCKSIKLFIYLEIYFFKPQTWVQDD